MWIGVTRGLAGIKFSLSIKVYPHTIQTTKNKKIKNKNPSISLKEKNEWKETL
jgi:hypothetical protein